MGKRIHRYVYMHMYMYVYVYMCIHLQKHIQNKVSHNRIPTVPKDQGVGTTVALLIGLGGAQSSFPASQDLGTEPRAGSHWEECRSPKAHEATRM